MSDIVNLWREIDAIKRILDRMPNEDGTGGGSGFISGSGTTGRVMQWASPSSATDANLIGPASNLLTLAATVPATLTVPATGTAALMSYANTGYMSASTYLNAGSYVNAATYVQAGTNLIIPATSSTAGQIQQPSGTRLLHTYAPGGTTYPNFFAGYNAGNFTCTSTTGANVGIGGSVMSLLRAGYFNVGVGTGSFANLRDGSSNVAIGFALYSLQDGSGNMAIGTSAMLNASSSQDCVSIGTNSLNKAQNASYHVAIGTSALYSNVSGSRTVAIGLSSGFYSTGSYNVYLGNQSGYNHTGSYSVLIGADAGYNETNSYRLYIEPTNSALPLIYGQFDAPSYLQINSKTTTADAVREVLRLQAHVSTASTGASAGFGPALTFYGESATDESYRQMGQIECVWSTATDATRKATVNHYVHDTAARRWISATADGAQAIAGMGTDPVANQLLTISAATATNCPLTVVSTDYSLTKMLLSLKYDIYAVAGFNAQGQFAVGNVLGGSGVPQSYIGAWIVNRNDAATVYGSYTQGQLYTGTANRNVIGSYILGGSYTTTANINSITGITALAQHTTTAAVNLLIGMYHQLQQTAAGSISQAYGANYYLSQNLGTISNLYGLRIGETAGGNVVQGTVTNAFGLYINDISGAATLNYALYTNVGLNRFGDQVDVIGSADRVQLRATGYTTQGSPVAHFIDNQTTANAVREVLRLEARVSTASTGSSAGFGPALDFYGESATDTNHRQMARIWSPYVVATDASRNERLQLETYPAGTAVGHSAFWSATGIGAQTDVILNAAGDVTESITIVYTWAQISGTAAGGGTLTLGVNEGAKIYSNADATDWLSIECDSTGAVYVDRSDEGDTYKVALWMVWI